MGTTLLIAGLILNRTHKDLLGLDAEMSAQEVRDWTIGSPAFVALEIKKADRAFKHCRHALLAWAAGLAMRGVLFGA
jgi:hypothetical protein